MSVILVRVRTMSDPYWAEYYQKMDRISNYLIFEDQNTLLEKDIPTAKEAHEKAKEFHRNKLDSYHEVYRVYLVDDFFKKGTQNGVEQWKPRDCPDCRMPEGKCFCDQLIATKEVNEK